MGWATAVLDAAATVLAAAALVLAGLALVASRSPRAALSVLLDLLLAAGLLRLATADAWRAILTAAAVVAVRKIAVTGLTSPARTRRGASRP